MCTRQSKTKLAIAHVLIIAAFCAGCAHRPSPVSGFQLNLTMLEAESPEEIEHVLKANLASGYSVEDASEIYKLYRVTNGPNRWAFVKVDNTPRGTYFFNLYCYAQERSNLWTLRGYSRVAGHEFTSSTNRDLTFQTDRKYINVIFRGENIFTVANQNGTNGAMVH
jgi:hypothetical protein